MNQWCLVNDSLILGHIQNDSGQTRYKAILTDKRGKVIRYFLNYDLLENRGSRVVGGSVQIFEFNNKLFFKEQSSDTLFSLNKDYKLVPEYIFNLGNLKMPATIRTNFSEYFQKINDYVAIESIFQSNDYLFLRVNFGNRFPARRISPKQNNPAAQGAISVNPMLAVTNTTSCLGIYNKRSGKLSFCKPTSTDNPLFSSGIYNDIDGGPRFFPRRQINDSMMAMTVLVKDLKAHVASDDFKKTVPKYPEKKKELEKLTGRLSEFDNPVIMLVTFKK